MKKFLRISALALAVIFAVSCFAACGEKAPVATDGTEASTGESTAVSSEAPVTKTYKIVSDNAFSPFEYLDTATNTYVGFDMDLLAAIAADQGFTYTMENVGFDPALAAVQAGQADAVIAGMTIKPAREEIFDFSVGYFEDGQIMTVAADSKVATLDDLKGLVVATKAGTMGLEFAEANKDAYGFTTMMFESSPEMYQAVAQGTCAACFEDRSVIADGIKNGQPLKTVGDVINPAFYGFAVMKGENAELIEMFNKGLENVKSNGTYDALLAKYGM